MCISDYEDEIPVGAVKQLSGGESDKSMGLTGKTWRCNAGIVRRNVNSYSS